MSQSRIGAECLRDCLAATPPADLLGMRLMRARSQLGFYPAEVPRETLIEAVSEMVAYTQRCTTAARRVSRLASMPVTNLTALEFGL